MLRFARARLLYLALLLGSSALVSLGVWPLAVPVLLTLAFGVLLAWGSARIDSSFFVPTQCAGPPTAPLLALTFDDGPDELTPQVLDVLHRQQVPATFFCIGQRVQQRPAVVQRAAAEGHLIANHSFSHGYLFDLHTRRGFARELEQTSQAIAAATGRRPRLFRPPYGVTTPGLAAAIEQGGYSCVGWNVRTLDTVSRSEAQLLARALAGLAPGAVYLFHDTVPATLAVLEAFIVEARRRGYQFVPLDQLLALQPYV